MGALVDVVGRHIVSYWLVLILVRNILLLTLIIHKLLAESVLSFGQSIRGRSHFNNLWLWYGILSRYLILFCLSLSYQTPAASRRRVRVMHWWNVGAGRGLVPRGPHVADRRVEPTL